jgi:hypothetical protein
MTPPAPPDHPASAPFAAPTLAPFSGCLDCRTPGPSTPPRPDHLLGPLEGPDHPPDSSRGSTVTWRPWSGQRTPCRLRPHKATRTNGKPGKGEARSLAGSATAARPGTGCARWSSAGGSNPPRPRCSRSEVLPPGPFPPECGRWPLTPTPLHDPSHQATGGGRTSPELSPAILNTARALLEALEAVRALHRERPADVMTRRLKPSTSPAGNRPARPRTPPSRSRSAR